MSHPKLDQIGGYRVLEYINEGGMAWVFKVQHPNLDRRLALKLLKTSAGSGDEVRLFKREIDQLTKATHPNLVWILDQGQDPQTGSFWYAMEYLSGDTVREYVTRHGPMDPVSAVALFKGLLAGLQTLHSRNVVHRDIKPSNIMIEPGNQAKLMDLGIARVIEGDGSQEVSYTNANIVRGTPAYMAPEQSSAKSLTPAADIFAVGLTLYYALTGHTVYEDLEDVDSTSAEDIRGYLYYLDRQHQNLKLRLPKELPKGLQDVVRKAAATEPSARYQTAGEMLADLEKCLSPQTSFGWMRNLAIALVGLGLLYFAGPPLLERARELTASTPVERPSGGASEALEASREAALVAREKATQAAVALPEYTAQMQRAEERFETAQQQFEAASDAASERIAVTTFAEATALFVEATAVGPASARRDQALALEQAKRREGISDFKRWDKMKRSAELSYNTQRYTNAEDDFSKGIAYLNGLTGSAPTSVVERSPVGAVVSAKRGDPVELAVRAVDPEGRTLRYAWSVDGTALIESVGAALEFRPSADRHEVVVQISSEDGRTTEERWTIESGDPLELLASAPTADRITITRGEAVALSVEANGSDLAYEWKVGDRRLPEKSARLRFDPQRTSSVVVAVRNAAGEQVSRTWQVVVEDPRPSQADPIQQPKPLRVISRNPVAPDASVDAGAPVTLSVQASGDELAYLWKVGNIRQSASGASLTIRPKQSVRVELTVEDKYGKRSSESWNVVVRGIATGAPPRIRSKTPAESALKVARGARVSLEVDAEGDGLRYAWTVDGRRSSDTDAKLALTVNSNTRVEAQVSDARDQTPEGGVVAWQIDVNRPPEISRISPGQSLTLKAGERAQLRIEARDPDGDPVETEWRRDGRRVATGSSYTVEAKGTETVRLTAVAKDAWDATELAVVVTVEAASASPLDQRFAALIAEFETAYESCSKAQLARIWTIPAAEDGQWRYAVCKSEFDLSVALVPGSASQDTARRTARACADWVLDRGNRGTVTKQVTLEVLLRPDWEAAQIQQIRDGCGS